MWFEQRLKWLKNFIKMRLGFLNGLLNKKIIIMNISPESVIGQQPNKLPIHSNLSDHFWHPRTPEEIALAQGVKPIEDFQKLLGGWPEDELDDNFEETLSHWRNEKT